MNLRAAAAGLATLIISLAALVAASEAALRIYARWWPVYDIEMSRYAMELKVASDNPRIGHVHRPDSGARLMGVSVRINSDGFRDHEYQIARNGKRRVIFLGDSLTFGWGVEESKTFKEILEAAVSKVVPTEVLNFGTGNYNTAQEVNLFLEKGLKYRPDEVIVFYFINDAEPTPAVSHWEMLGHLRIVTFLWSRVNSALVRLGRSKQFREYYADLYADQQPGWIAAKAAFVQLGDICRENGITLKVILLPELHMLHDYPFAGQHGKVMAFLRDKGIEARDLAPFFAAETNPTRLWVAADDAHPNEIAHALIAKYSLDFLMEGSNGRVAGGAH